MCSHIQTESWLHGGAPAVDPFISFVRYSAWSGMGLQYCEGKKQNRIFCAARDAILGGEQAFLLTQSVINLRTTYCHLDLKSPRKVVKCTKSHKLKLKYHDVNTNFEQLKIGYLSLRFVYHENNMRHQRVQGHMGHRTKILLQKG